MRKRPATSVGAVAVGTFALGSLALGAIAIGAVAVGAMAIGALAIKRPHPETGNRRAGGAQDHAPTGSVSG